MRRRDHPDTVVAASTPSADTNADESTDVDEISSPTTHDCQP
jgi:hypothetical protein